MKRWLYIVLGALAPLVLIAVTVAVGLVLFYGFRYESHAAGSVGILILYGTGILFLPIGYSTVAASMVLGGFLGWLLHFLKNRRKVRQVTQKTF